MIDFWGIFKKKESPVFKAKVGEGMTDEQTKKAYEVISKPRAIKKVDFWGKEKPSLEFKVGEGITTKQSEVAKETIQKHLNNVGFENYDRNPFNPAKGFWDSGKPTFSNNINTSLSIVLSPTTSREEKLQAFDILSAPAIGATSGLQKSAFSGLNSKGLITNDVLNMFAKDKSPSSIERSLKQLGVDDINAKNLSEQLAPTKTVDEVKTVLSEYSATTKALPEATTPKKIKITEDIKDIVSKEIHRYDPTPLTVNGKIDLSNTDIDFRLMQLKEKVQTKALTTKEVEEAISLLKQVGIDITKPDPVRLPEKPIEPYKPLDEYLKENQTPAEKIISTGSQKPTLIPKRDINITTLSGEKIVIPQNEVLEAYESGSKILLKGKKEYIVSKSQYDNVRNNSLKKETTDFAPELKQTEETIKTEKKEFADLENMGMGNLRKGTKYSQYTLPGGENYKEILIKAPVVSESEARQANGDKIAMDLYGKTARELWDSGKMDEWNKVSELNKTGYGIPAFRGSHWDEPNVISHIRMNERTYDGKKVAFMEELQSDWAREGRDKGFIKPDEKLVFSIKQTPNGEWSVIDQNNHEIVHAATKEYVETKAKEYNKDGLPSHLRDNRTGVPSNPLLKNWQELSIKRALQEAVNSNAKYFAWINGPQTAARYNLSKQVDNIDWKPFNDGKMITINPIGGSAIEVFTDENGLIKDNIVGKNMPSEWKGKNIADAIGKGISEKIMQEKSGSLKGDGLNVGGSWASNLYDRQVRTIVENLTGQKVEMLDMGLPVNKDEKVWQVSTGQYTIGDDLTSKNIKVGLEIAQHGDIGYVVTDILKDGKFKAVSKERMDDLGEGSKWNYKEIIEHLPKAVKIHEKEFVIKGKTSSQMGIELTPEVKAIVKGEMKLKLPEEGEVTFDRTVKEIEAQLEKIFGKKVPFKEVFNAELDLGDAKAVGRAKKDLVYLLKENGSLSEAVATHEGYHWAKMNMPKEDAIRLSQIEKELVKANPNKVKALKELGYKDEDIAEEMGANEFAKFYKTGKTFSGKIKAFFQRILNRLKLIFSKRSDLIKEFSNIKKTINKQGERMPSKNRLDLERVSQADRLIAEGKIRVKSVNGRDTYQVQKGKEWVNVRDEDSAVKYVTKVTTPKPEIQLSPELEKARTYLEIRKEMIDNSDLRPLLKMVRRKGEFKGQLKEEGFELENNLKGEGSEETRARMEKYIQDRADYKEDLRAFNEQKKAYLSSLKEKKVEQVTTSEALKSNPILVDTKTGEGRSLEIQALQELNKIDEPIRSEVSSLPKIVLQEQTKVNNKINFLDWIRTPDRVMEKIGFKKEMDAVRAGYDGYVKELPKNLDKITEWSKQVSPESNKNIFKYLDGQPITLRPDEQKVADEIQVWFKDWAKRLKLPEDAQISHYITHIFDEQLLKKEFDEELAKIIDDKIPGQVYDPFLEKRLGAKGYIQDTWAALDAYVKRATRKVHMDPALEMIRAKAGSSSDMANIELSQFKFVQKFVDNLNMRPSELDTYFDNALKSTKLGYKLGQRPVTAILRTLRQMTFSGMLGLNPGSALRNLSQGVNIYSKLGEKYTVIGYAKLFNPSSYAELEREGVLASGFIQDRNLSAVKKTMEKVDKTLFVFFDTAEKINRGAAYFGAKAKGLSQGMTEKDAIEYAKKIVRDTQFSYATLDTPVMLQGDIAKTLLQFQTYGVKQTEFLAEMLKNKEYSGIIRYVLAGLAFVYTVGRAFGMKPTELIPFYSQFAGKDGLMPTPPSLKLPVEIGKALVNAPDKYGQERDWKKKLDDVLKSGIGLIPAGSQVKKSIEGATAVKEGASYDKGGNLQFIQGQSLTDKVQAVLFGKYASSNAQDYFNKSEDNKKELKRIKPIYEEVQALKDDNPIEAQAIVNGLSEEDYALYKKYNSNIKAEATIEGKKKMLPIYNKVQSLKETNLEEAKKIVNELSDEDYKYYQAVAKQVKEQKKAAEGEKPEFTEEPQTPESLIKTVFTYAKAIGVDPATAFNRIFTGQKIRYIANNTIVVERMDLKESQKVKKERGGNNPDMKLDHTIPLQLGGSNSEDNLLLVPTDQWESYTEVENYLGKKLRSGDITKKQAQEAISQFKLGEITAEEVFTNY